MSGIALTFLPFISWPLYWLACATVAVLASLLIILRRRGWPLRILSLVLLLAALANPQLNSEERQQLPDIAVVVVDESASQKLGNRKNDTEKALADVEQRIKALGNTELRVARTVTGSTPETDGTRMFSLLAKTVETIPAERYAGAILITDGQVHDTSAVLPKQLANAPIHILLSGKRNEVDRRIVVDQAPRFAITGQPQVIRFHVEDLPASDQTATVTIRTPDGRTEELQVPVNAEQTYEITLEHAGQNTIELSVDARPGELTTVNNSALVSIKGIRDRLRVLLVSGEPHPGERTWRNLLKADAAVDLVHFTILRPPEKQDGTLTKELSLIAFPTRELFIEKISSFDLVIFDRYRIQSILPEAYLANVADYVRQGGAVLISSGPDLAAPDGLAATPLADVMVAIPTGTATEMAFRPSLTVDGTRHPVSQNLPGSGKADGTDPNWGRWFRSIDAIPGQSTNTLLQTPDGKPLLVVGHVGEGRVAQFLSDQGWLWARGFDGGGPQMEILRRLAHWLMKEPDLEEEALSARQDGDGILIERRTMAKAVDPVLLKKPDGGEQQIKLTETAPGMFSARVPFEQSGLYSLQNGELSTITAIGNTDDKEFADVRATDARLAPIAESTRSGIYWIEASLPAISKVTAGQTLHGSNWLALRDNQQYRVMAIRGISLFAGLLGLSALLLIVMAMWYREGR